jgi:serine/threonine protein kinase
VHRDVKPQNIRIGVHGNVKLLDFGLARTVDPPDADAPWRPSRTGVVGTPDYLAPERLDAAREPTPASDVYALGCVLYEGTTASRLMEGVPIADRFRMAGDPSAWSAFVRARLGAVGDPAVRDLLAEVLAHDVDARPTAGALRERCEGLVARVDPSARLARWCRARSWPDGVSVARSAPAPGGSPHLPADRLGTAPLTDEEEEHLAGCIECRANRRLRLAARRIGPYRLLGRVGRGGMGEVYAAVSDRGERRALKVLRVRRQGLDQRLAREARLQARIDSDHVLPLCDVLDHDGAPVLVLPFVEGPTLAVLLAAHPLPHDAAAALFADVVTGVAALHAAGVVHRDLKPANVLLDPSSGRVIPKVADLGLARALDDDGTALTGTGLVLGTPAYAAPEQLRSPRDADARADVWALGRIATELFGGSPPAGWSDLVGRMLLDDPDARPADAGAVQALLPPTGPLGPEWVGTCSALAPPLEPIRWDSSSAESALGPSRGSVAAEAPPEVVAHPVSPRRVGRTGIAVGGITALAAAIAITAPTLGVLPRARVDVPVVAPTPTPPPPAPGPVPRPDAPAPAPVVPVPRPAPTASTERPPPERLVPVWVKTRPWGHVQLGSNRWTTEDRAMALPVGTHHLALASHDGRYAAEVDLEVRADGANLCWNFAAAARCSP